MRPEDVQNIPCTAGSPSRSNRLAQIGGIWSATVESDINAFLDTCGIDEDGLAGD